MDTSFALSTTLTTIRLITRKLLYILLEQNRLDDTTTFDPHTFI